MCDIIYNTGRPVDWESCPIVIDHAGSYVLTDNLMVGDPDADAIRIDANDVTLDLNGHTIHGPASGGTGNGIWAENRYSISVLNGRVWGFGGSGISLLSTSGHPSEKNAGHIIMNMQALNNHASGIGIGGGTVSNCIANGNGAYRSSVTGCTASDNTHAGISAYGYDNPALPNADGTGHWMTGDPFINVQTSWYWSSTTYVDDTDQHA